MKLNIFVALALSTSVLTLAAPVPTGAESLTRAFVSVRKALTKVGSGSSRKVEGSMYNEGINHDTNIPGHSSIPPPSHSNPKSSADSTPDHSPPASPPPRQPSTTHAYPDSAHRGGQRHAPAAASGHLYPDTAPLTTEHRAPVAPGRMHPHPGPSQLGGQRHAPVDASGNMYPDPSQFTTHRAPVAEHGSMYPDPREHGGSLYAPAAASSGHFVGMEHMLPTGVKPHPESSYGGMQFGGSTQHYPTQHAPAAYPHDNYAGYPNTYAGSQGSYSGSHGNYAGYHELWSPLTYRPGHSVPGQSYSEMGTNRRKFSSCFRCPLDQIDAIEKLTT
ncbi:uncharacterized protein UTRI_06546 [Ustilago trichophora]|uniref:Uncharacterized protein n=1 Tax=Ustilago trichophora TaxID=86804 RepID=A0A5C3ENY2_9BASI|nr:uncharacterized protein UTRI_06546 [Ustilago trichophora]